MDSSTASRLAFDALAHAVAGDGDGAATALITLGENADDNLMYGACCGLAEAGAMMLRRFYGAHAPRPGSDDMFVIEQLKPGGANDDPAEMFAARFLIAWANGDTSTCLALYEVALGAGGEQYVDSITALLKTVAGVTRLALDEKRGDQ